MIKRGFFYLFSLAVFVSCASSAASLSSNGSISPISNGLLNAKTGEERFDILWKTHKEAIEKGLLVDYHGIDTIRLSIPQGAQSIPLGSNNDFSGVVFVISNKVRDIYLFSLVNAAERIIVSAQDIDKGSFVNYPQLNYGTVLLKIEDQKPWVNNRKGYSYGHTRRDILLISDGNAKNKTIMPYNNAQSLPSCFYFKSLFPSFSFKNLTLFRTTDCTAKTFLCDIAGLNDVHFKRIHINTPPDSGLVNDMIFHIIDCTNVFFEDVTIEETYSRSNYDGYGFSLSNIWNLQVKRLKGRAKWGIFGNNNINKAIIEDSDINRFDVHCYCRDICFNNVSFSKLYNQFSSVFGTISFIGCEFKDFVPVLYESSYNSYTNHSLLFKNCVFDITKIHNYLIDIGILSKEKNNRAELREKWWPEITIKDMFVNVPKEVNEMNLFHFVKAQRTAKIENLAPIVINGLSFIYEEGSSIIDFNLSAVDANSESGLDILVSKVSLLPNKAKMDFRDSVLRQNKGRININIKGNNLSDRIVIKRSFFSE